MKPWQPIQGSIFYSSYLKRAYARYEHKFLEYLLHHKACSFDVKFCLYLLKNLKFKGLEIRKEEKSVPLIFWIQVSIFFILIPSFALETFQYSHMILNSAELVLEFSRLLKNLLRFFKRSNKNNQMFTFAPNYFNFSANDTIYLITKFVIL